MEKFNLGSFLEGGGLGDTLSGVGALGDLFLGIQQYGLAKDQFKFNKQSFASQFANQANQYNNYKKNTRDARIRIAEGLGNADHGLISGDQLLAQQGLNIDWQAPLGTGIGAPVNQGVPVAQGTPLPVQANPAPAIAAPPTAQPTVAPALNYGPNSQRRVN